MHECVQGVWRHEHTIPVVMNLKSHKKVGLRYSSVISLNVYYSIAVATRLLHHLHAENLEADYSQTNVHLHSHNQPKELSRSTPKYTSYILDVYNLCNLM